MEINKEFVYKRIDDILVFLTGILIGVALVKW